MRVLNNKSKNKTQPKRLMASDYRMALTMDRAIS
jgi:hypothetical protein